MAVHAANAPKETFREVLRARVIEKVDLHTILERAIGLFTSCVYISHGGHQPAKAIEFDAIMYAAMMRCFVAYKRLGHADMRGGDHAPYGAVSAGNHGTETDRDGWPARTDRDKQTLRATHQKMCAFN